MKMSNPGYIFIWLFAFLLTACSTTAPKINNGADFLDKPVTEINEDLLLEVWIEIFDPGQLPVDDKNAQGLSVEIREAEARFIPVHLRDTMEKTGYWGGVRVVPELTEGGEMWVSGTILASDGESLQLEITAQDATGRKWFRRNYGLTLTPDSNISSNGHDADAFQDLYNLIANDLAYYRNGLSPADITRIRHVAEMRFAADLAPDAFSRYLVNEDGIHSIVGLPAVDDPMYQRIQLIRERDFMLIDTLNGHFDNYYYEMAEPYTEWRRARSEEAEALRKIKRDANKHKALGIAAIVGAIALEMLGNGDVRVSTQTLRDVMVLGGVYAVKTGFEKDSESAIHRAAIEELDASFSAEAQPLVVNVEGETHELTGSAETQYAKWRDLLRRIYASETGLAEVTN
jgi:hypothetical protein